MIKAMARGLAWAFFIWLIVFSIISALRLARGDDWKSVFTWDKYAEDGS